MKIDKGPFEALAVLARGGTPQELQEAQEFQREAFRARFGCYMEDMLEVCPECPQDAANAEWCPIWLPLRDQLRTDETMATRLELARLHSVAEDPCVVCGGACDVFFCWSK